MHYIILLLSVKCIFGKVRMVIARFASTHNNVLRAILAKL